MAWSLIGLAAAAVAAYELLPQLGKRLRHRFKFQHGYKPYFGAGADAYRDQPWAAPMFREFFEHVRVEWAPLVGWRHTPFAGTYHTFDSEGRRRTINPAAGRSGEAPARIFMFGGSTIMGMGARDEGTVPSLLARKLHDAGHGVEITNYGQLGYVMAQEVVLLIEELKKGRVADLVVFTDGLNEVMTAEHQGQPGRIWQEHNRRQEFNLIQPYRRADLLRYGARAFIPDTAKALGLFEPPVDAPARVTDVDRLADDVLRQYAWNVRLVRGLAAQFKFRVVFFWQPAIFMKKNATAFEGKLKREGDTPLFRAVYGKRARALAPLEGVIDMAGVFEDAAEGVYYDAHHLTERGNALVADAMLPHVVAALRPPA